MAQKPKTYTPKFTFQLVLEILRAERSEVEIGRIYGVHHCQESAVMRLYDLESTFVLVDPTEIERKQGRPST